MYIEALCKKGQLKKHLSKTKVKTKSKCAQLLPNRERRGKEAVLQNNPYIPIHTYRWEDRTGVDKQLMCQWYVYQ